MHHALWTPRERAAHSRRPRRAPYAERVPQAANDHRDGRRAAIVVHPNKVDLDALRLAVERAEQSHGWEPSLWLETTPDRLGDTLAREAIEAGAGLVVAAGGDGTVRAVADALEDTATALGIVPAGTGNLLARNLSIDVTDLQGAVETAFGGIERRIDVGHARAERPDGTRENFVFTVLGGVGVDAGMIANTPSALKKRVGWLAYLTGIHRTIVRGSNFTARIRIDDSPADALRAQSIMVGNCGLMPGGVLLLPDAEIDDGLLDACVLRPRGVLGWLQISLRMVWHTVVTHSEQQTGRKVFGQARDIRALRYEQGKTVVFRLTSGPEEFEIDGEAVGEVVAAHLSVNPSALLVRAPAREPLVGRLMIDEMFERGRRHRLRMRRRVAEARLRLRRATSGLRSGNPPASTR